MFRYKRVFIYMIGLLLCGILTGCGKSSEREETIEKQEAAAVTQPEERILQEAKIETEEGVQQEAEENERISEQSWKEALVRNNYYNTYSCYGNGYLYVYDVTGIYRIKDGEDEWELIYDKQNPGKRGIEIWKQYLYFCDYEWEEAEEEEDYPANNCIKRINLETLEEETIVEDIFGYDIQFYENQMYVKTDGFLTACFELNDTGIINRDAGIGQKDTLYKRWDRYYEEWNEAVSNSEDLEKYQSFIINGREPIVDIIYAKNCTGGFEIYSSYKDELMGNILLYNPDTGEEQKLLETIGYPAIVTPEGIYYYKNVNMDIAFLDYTSKESKDLYICDTAVPYNFVYMCTFDENYIYGITEGAPEEEDSLVKIRREDGFREVICSLEYVGNVNLMYHCSVAGGRFFIEKRQSDSRGRLTVINMETKEVTDLGE